MNSALDRRARAAFDDLSRDEVVAAVKRMAAEGLSEYAISAACRLAVEEVRRILSEPES